MKKLIFISRHQPTAQQIEVARDKGYELVPVGDLDAFDPKLGQKVKALVKEHQAAGGVADHPLIFVALLNAWQRGPSSIAGVFQNICRPVEGGPLQQDECGALELRQIWSDDPCAGVGGVVS